MELPGSESLVLDLLLSTPASLENENNQINTSLRSVILALAVVILTPSVSEYFSSSSQDLLRQTKCERIHPPLMTRCVDVPL